MPQIQTKLGIIKYNELESTNEYLGLRYASAGRFEYAKIVEKYDDVYDATSFGASCTQKRCYYAHLEIPERMFYHKEYREGIDFTYSEDCFFLNIWTPKEKGTYPVFIFIHGGGFDSGCIEESPFDGRKLAERGLVVVTIQYRVGPLGFFTNEELYKRNGHDGNYGLDDQIKAITFIKTNISDFYGDPTNITLCGQSAGAISIQLLCMSEHTKGLFQRDIMMSGGGLWPIFASPRKCTDTREYWNEVMEIAGCKNVDEFSKLDIEKLFDALEIQKSRRKDNTFHQFPVIDNYILSDTCDKLIKKVHDIDYMIGYTNNDMYTLILGLMAEKYRKQVNGYLYYFDVDAKGDNNKAFHSADLRYIFGTLEKSWRPYDESDYMISNMMMDYVANFCKTGDPNSEGLPLWTKSNKALTFRTKKKVKMTRPNKLILLKNTFLGDPK